MSDAIAAPKFSAGFDSYGYPGDAEMDWICKNTNLVFCGYYLAPAPSHPRTSWMGHREHLESIGFGVVPIYVGQQVVPPGSLNPSARNGTIDGANACALMAQEGFEPGWFVFLDVENGPPLPDLMGAYIRAWGAAVGAGGYGVGVYCSHDLAQQIQDMLPNARIWATRVSTMAPQVMGPTFPEGAPGDGGYAKAWLWQHAENCRVLLPVELGAVLIVDVNVAVGANPASL